MKTFSTCLLLVAALSCCFTCALMGQSTNPVAEKKIVITTRSTDADGSERTEIIVKKGKSAESFDVDQYVKAHNKDGVIVDVQVVQTAPESDVEVYGINTDNFDVEMRDDEQAFLGVQEDADEDEDAPGLQIEVVKNSAAAKAGLKTNDILLFLNGKPVNSWSDVTKLIRKAKPGQSMDIRYSRDGKEATTTATLSTQSATTAHASNTKNGFLGVEPAESEENDVELPGVEVDVVKNSAAEKTGLKDGDRIEKLNDTDIEDWEDISDFMAETNAGDKVNITYSRNGQRNTAEALIGAQNDWDWNNWNTENWNWRGLDVNVKEKAACLGVYTGTYAQDNIEGAKIDGFTNASAAETAKMQTGDVILSVNGKKVKNHDDLWNEIALYKPEEKVNVAYQRGDQKLNVEATLKACQDNSNRIILNETNEQGDNQSRQFLIWNWGPNEQTSMRERHVITIHKGEGDGEKVNTPLNNAIAIDRGLKLDDFKAYPNPTQGQVTVAFRAPAVPTIVSLFDVAGRQLFREELNAFNGDYIQQFDLSEYAKGNILIQVLQGDKVFSEQIIVN